MSTSIREIVDQALVPLRRDLDDLVRALDDFADTLTKEQQQ